MAWRSLVERHPQTTFIGAHVGCYAENLAWVGALLDRCPNFYVDIAARIGELGRQPYTARRFFMQYADRILFGIDAGADLETVSAVLSLPGNRRRILQLQRRRNSRTGPLVRVRLASAAGRVEESLHSKRRARHLQAQIDQLIYARQRTTRTSHSQRSRFRLDAGRIDRSCWRKVVLHSGLARSICWALNPPDRIVAGPSEVTPIWATRSASPQRRPSPIRSACLHVTLTADAYPQWPNAFVLQWTFENVGASAADDRSLDCARS